MMHARKWLFPAVCLVAAAWLAVAVSADPAGEEGKSDEVAADGGEQKIGVLNVGYIVKNMPRLQTDMEKLKADMAEEGKECKVEAEKIRQKTQQLQLLGPAAENPEQMRREITEAQAALTAKVQVQRQEFMLRQSKLYSVAYERIAKEAEQYGKANGFSMVLNLYDESVDATDPKKVAARMSRTVIWHNDECDITEDVFKRLNAADEPL